MLSAIHRHRAPQIRSFILFSRQHRGPSHVYARARFETRIGGLPATRWRELQPQAGQVRCFHATPRRDGLIHLLANVLKASASLEYARMAARIALTFLPVVIIKNHFSKKYMKHLSHKPEYAEKTAEVQKMMRRGVIFYRVLIAVPLALFALTSLASLERTPLSGRWRLIFLSPEEEEGIASQLQGTGWFHAVYDMLSEDGPSKIIPSTDWRYQWVNDTLRQLETIVPILAKEKVIMKTNQEAKKEWLYRSPDDYPLPPPSKYPLRPRPAAKDYLRWFCDKTAGHPQSTAIPPHTISGPPYSLLLIDDPDCDTAFAYGFGPNGGGGIVVYSGFLDRVLAKFPSTPEFSVESPRGSQTPSDVVPSRFLGGLFSRRSSQDVRPPVQTPTQEQTDELAILLSHELAHLVLSHHLEMLSSATVVIPGALSMLSDLMRAVLFPVTMLFGPFVNDAVANFGRVGSMEVGKLSEYCTSLKQEFEADAVSARILAHAGYDARKAVRFWETRRDAESSECSPPRTGMALEQSALARRMSSASHPRDGERVARLQAELDNWERIRKIYVKKVERYEKRHGTGTGMHSHDGAESESK